MNTPTITVWRNDKRLILQDYFTNKRALHEITNAQWDNIQWWRDQKVWTLPVSHVETLRDWIVQERGVCIVQMQAARKPGRCHEKCQTAKGLDCECSCVGTLHGTRAERQHTLDSGVIVTWDVDTSMPEWVRHMYRKA